LTFASASTGEKSGHDGIAGVETGREISDSNADFGGWTIAVPSDVHEAHLAIVISFVSESRVPSTNSRFDHHVVASLLPQRAGLTITGDACIDETWINLRKRLIVHAILLERIW